MKVKIDYEVLAELMEKATRLKVADELVAKYPKMNTDTLRTVFGQGNNIPPHEPTETPTTDKNPDNDFEQEVETPDETPDKKSSTTKNRNKIDSGKVLALRNAKWGVAKIAEEMCCTVAEINQILKEESK